jgi:hypothetical protein
LCVCGLAAGVSSALASPPTPFTWTGTDSGSLNWSVNDNWGTTAPLAGDLNDALVFPAGLSTGDCRTTQNDACYFSQDDLTGYAVNSLTIDDASGYAIYADDANDPLTINAGGVNADTALDAINPSMVAIPITLGAAQTWTVNGGLDDAGWLTFTGNVTGPTHALAVALSNEGFLDFDSGSNNEVGNVTVTGADSGNQGAMADFNGDILLGDGSELNSVNGHSVTIDDAAIIGDGTVGPLIVQGGRIAPGLPTGDIAVNGTVSLDSASELDLAMNDTTTTAGSGYTQLTAGGIVFLGSSTLGFDWNGASSACPTLAIGNVYTLVSSGGSISGTFANAANGADISLACTGSVDPQLAIHYNTASAPNTVTATVVGPTVATTTTVSVTSASVISGQPATLTATVSAGGPVPLGTVAFADNGTPISGCTSQPVALVGSSGEATCTTALTGSSYSLTASFTPSSTETTGGPAASSSTAVTGELFVEPAQAVASVVKTAVKKTAASATLSCTGTTGPLVTPSLSTCVTTVALQVTETLKGNQVIAVSAKAPKTKKRTVTVGSGGASFSAGQQQTVTVQLNGTGKSLLRSHGGKLTVKLVVSSGGTVVGSQNVTFK